MEKFRVQDFRVAGSDIWEEEGEEKLDHTIMTFCIFGVMSLRLPEVEACHLDCPFL